MATTNILEQKIGLTSLLKLRLELNRILSSLGKACVRWLFRSPGFPFCSRTNQIRNYSSHWLTVLGNDLPIADRIFPGNRIVGPQLPSCILLFIPRLTCSHLIYLPGSSSQTLHLPPDIFHICCNYGYYRTCKISLETHSTAWHNPCSRYKGSPPRIYCVANPNL